MKMLPEILRRFLHYEDGLRLVITNSWESRADEVGYTWCQNCDKRIVTGDKCAVDYLEYVSLAFCLECYEDNLDILSQWIVPTSDVSPSPRRVRRSSTQQHAPQRVTPASAIITEEEWNVCNDIGLMLASVRGKITRRQLRLFGVACCRSIWDWIVEEASREAVTIAEKYADGMATQKELSAARRGADPRRFKSDTMALTCALSVTHQTAWQAAIDVAQRAQRTPRPAIWYRGERFLHPTNEFRRVCANACRQTEDFQKTVLAGILRDIINPFQSLGPIIRENQRFFQSVLFHPSKDTVSQIAKGIYEERAFGRMPILHDALLDLGCQNDEILLHCRHSEGHVRGCWVLDLILGKSRETRKTTR